MVLYEIDRVTAPSRNAARHATLRRLLRILEQGGDFRVFHVFDALQVELASGRTVDVEALRGVRRVHPHPLDVTGVFVRFELIDNVVVPDFHDHIEIAFIQRGHDRECASRRGIDLAPVPLLEDKFADRGM